MLHQETVLLWLPHKGNSQLAELNRVTEKRRNQNCGCVEEFYRAPVLSLLFCTFLVSSG